MLKTVMKNNADIILINPVLPSAEKNNFAGIQKSITDMVPLGLLYIATVLDANGYKVKVVDFNTAQNNEEREELLSGIIYQSPSVIGISVMTEAYYRAASLTKLIRQKLHDKSKIIWGGYHPTFIPDECLRRGLADIVVRGEGEEAMLQIVKVLLNQKAELSLTEIPGISYKENGKVFHNSPALLRIKNLNELPVPDRKFVCLDHYKNAGTLISSRGCVARCQFCAAGAMGRMVMRDADNVYKEIEILDQKHNLKYMFFVDNTFTTNKKRTMEIFDLIKKHNLNVYSKIESRVSQVDEEYIKFLAGANVFVIQFGIETGNAAIMQDIRKNITLDQVEAIVELCLKHSIQVTTYFIVGHPNDTPVTVIETIDFAKKIRRIGARVELGILTPFPGTEIFNRRDELNVEITDWNYENWNLYTPVMRTKYLSIKDIKRLYKEGLDAINSVG